MLCHPEVELQTITVTSIKDLEKEMESEFVNVLMVTPASVFYYYHSGGCKYTRGLCSIIADGQLKSVFLCKNTLHFSGMLIDFECVGVFEEEKKLEVYNSSQKF